MHLSIKKNKIERFFCHVKYSIEYKSILENDDIQLIYKFKDENTILLEARKNCIIDYEINITIKDLIKGNKYISDHIELLSEYEKDIKEAAKKLAIILNELKQLGNEYIYEVNPDSIKLFTGNETGNKI